MASFKVHGPYDLPSRKPRAGGRKLVFDDFWSGGKPAPFARKCGCYVFAIKTGRSLMPIYVGKATKTFKQEAFNPSNRIKFDEGFSHYKRGKPVIYLVIQPSQRGAINRKQIGLAEDFLIQIGAARNERLQNVVGAQKPNWSIQGVIRSGQGKPSKPEKDFRQMFGLKKE